MEDIKLEIQEVKNELEGLRTEREAATTAEERISVRNRIATIYIKQTALINKGTEVMKLSAGMFQNT